MRLGWRPVTGVKTVQSECGILATATPAPLRKNSGKYILAQYRALLQFETQALQHRLYEFHGVREASWISLSGCHPNRVQAISKPEVSKERRPTASWTRYGGPWASQ